MREDEREELALDRARRGESVILEKPASKADNVRFGACVARRLVVRGADAGYLGLQLRMLLDMNGEACQVTTAIVIGPSPRWLLPRLRH